MLRSQTAKSPGDEASISRQRHEPGFLYRLKKWLKRYIGHVVFLATLIFGYLRWGVEWLWAGVIIFVIVALIISAYNWLFQPRSSS
jgi:hypothetical protein